MHTVKARDYAQLYLPRGILGTVAAKNCHPFAFTIAFFLGIASAPADVIVDQTPGGGGNQGTAMGTNVAAGTFTISAPTQLGDFRFWLFTPGSDDDDISDFFSGDISVGLFDNSGAGASPGNLLDTENFTAVSMTDAGFNGPAPVTDVAFGDISLSSFGELGPGTYWLGLHENAWGSASDGTNVFWYYSGASTGFRSFTTNETNPTTGWSTPNTNTFAFTLAAAVPEPSTFALTVLGLVSLGMFGRRRRKR